MSITLETDGNTLLSGPVPDQPALYGILRRVRDLGLPLLSVNIISQIFPCTPMLVTGISGPGSFSHGPNENLDLKCCNKLLLTLSYLFEQLVTKS